MKIRVLVIDDSPVARKAITRALATTDDIEVVGGASDPFEARELIFKARPDVLTLDMEMPKMNGVDFLKRLMAAYPLPVIMLSAFTPKNSEASFAAYAAGALDVIAKPDSSEALATMGDDLARRIRAAAKVDPKRLRQAPTPAPAPAPSASPASPTGSSTIAKPWKLIAIGVSTGGPHTVERILRALPAGGPPILIVQHMPPGFTKAFAGRLDTVCAMSVREAQDQDRIQPGLALVAPGGHHLVVSQRGAEFRVLLRGGPPVHFCKPAVDVTFQSVAHVFGKRAVGVILTGMGEDGAAGLLQMRAAGARTFAQDQASSIVYGMPKAATENGAAERVVALDDIPRTLLHAAQPDRAPNT